MFTSAGILYARCRDGVEGGRWRRGKMKKSILHKINVYMCRYPACSMSIWSKQERLRGNTKKSTPIKNYFYIRRPAAAATWVRLCAGNGKKIAACVFPAHVVGGLQVHAVYWQTVFAAVFGLSNLKKTRY